MSLWLEILIGIVVILWIFDTVTEFIAYLKL